MSLGPYSMLERSNSKLIRYMRGWPLLLQKLHPLNEGNMSPIIVFGAVIIAREEHFEAYSLHEGLAFIVTKAASII